MKTFRIEFTPWYMGRQVLACTISNQKYPHRPILPNKGHSTYHTMLVVLYADLAESPAIQTTGEAGNLDGRLALLVASIAQYQTTARHDVVKECLLVEYDEFFSRWKEGDDGLVGWVGHDLHELFGEDILGRS